MMRRRRLCVALLAAAPAMVIRSAMADCDAPQAARLILRVEVEKVESTDFHPKPDHECPTGQKCIVWVLWTKYRARVLDVVSGTWAQPEVAFLHLEHSQYVPDVLRDCYVVLRPSGTQLRESLPLDWVATEILSARLGDGERIEALREGR